MCNFQGLIQEELEFRRKSRKIYMEFPGILMFGLEISKEYNAI